MSEEVADVWIGEVSGALLGTEVVTGCAEAVGTLPGCPRCRVLLRSMRDWGRDETGLPGSTDEDNNAPRSEADVALGLAAEGARGSEADVAPRSETDAALGLEVEPVPTPGPLFGRTVTVDVGGETREDEAA